MGGVDTKCPFARIRPVLYIVLIFVSMAICLSFCRMFQLEFECFFRVIGHRKKLPDRVADVFSICRVCFGEIIFIIFISVFVPKLGLPFSSDL